MFFLRDLLDTGGVVLYPILFVTFCMWTLILERLWYLVREHPQNALRIEAAWNARSDRDSWSARKLRGRWVSEASLELRRSLPTLQALVAICPLLGLLGTVTGMVDVFEIMALTESGSARSLADGVMRATVPTLAGLAASLSGLYPSVSLPRRAELAVDRLRDRLGE